MLCQRQIMQPFGLDAEGDLPGSAAFGIDQEKHHIAAVIVESAQVQMPAVVPQIGAVPFPVVPVQIPPAQNQFPFAALLQIE